MEIYEKEINGLIKDLSKELKTEDEFNKFSRLCFLIGCLQGEVENGNHKKI